MEMGQIDTDNKIQILSDIAICCGFCCKSNATDVIVGSADSKYQIHFWKKLIETIYISKNIDFKSYCDSLDSHINAKMFDKPTKKKEKIVDADILVTNFDKAREEYLKNMQTIQLMKISYTNPVEQYKHEFLNMLMSEITETEKELSSFTNFYHVNLKYIIWSAQKNLNPPIIIDSNPVKNAYNPLKYCLNISESMSTIKKANIDSNEIAPKFGENIDRFININETFYKNLD
ncbi:hypothetical protein HZS_6902 [Henneguya salminicola]|nr:hypothetical protein HZS_6902 [Henneguya salminicola]